MKSIDKFVLVLVASLALLLAGCGGGSSTQTPTDPPPDPGPTAAEMQYTAVHGAIAAAQAAVAGLTAMSSDADVTAAEALVAEARTALNGANLLSANQVNALDNSLDDIDGDLVTAKASIADHRQMVADNMMNQRNAADTAIQAAMDAVAGLSGMSTDEEVMAAKADIQTAKDAVAAATALSMAERDALTARIGMIETTLASTEMDIADHRDEEQRTGVSTAIDEAMAAVGGLSEMSTDEEVNAAKALITAAENALTSATSLLTAEQALALNARIATIKTTLASTEIAIAAHREQVDNDNETQRMADVSAARMAAMQSYMDADADATKAEEAATAAEGTAPGSAGAMAAREAANAARMAANDAKAAHDAIMDGMTKEEADAEAAKAATAASNANSSYMTAMTENNRIQDADRVAEIRQIEDAQDAADAAVMAAEAAKNAAAMAKTAAEQARDDAHAAYMRAIAARTDSTNAKAEYEKAKTAATDAGTAANAAETAYMAAKNAADGIMADGTAEAAQMAQMTAEDEQGKAETAQTMAETEQGNAEAAETAAVAAAGDHVLRLFLAANGAHVMDDETTMNVDEKAAHVASVGTAMATIAAVADGNQTAGTTVTITYPGDTVDNPATEDTDEFSEGTQTITVTVNGNAIVAELRESRAATDLNNDGDTNDTGEAAYTQTARKIADLGVFDGYELWEDDGDAATDTDRARAILFTNKQKGDDSVLAVTAATARSATAVVITTATELAKVTSTGTTITGVEWTPSGDTAPLTGTLTCPANTACDITLGDDGAVTAISGYTFTGSRAAVEAVTAADATEDNNYLAFGLWLEDDGTNDTFGSFAVGGTGYAVNVQNAVTGTATYRGNAAGAHHKTGEGVNWFHGDATLTANFGAIDTDAERGTDPAADTSPGTISGEISNIRVNGGPAMSDSIVLRQAALTDGTATFNGNARMGAGEIQDNDTVEYPYNGTWSGSFYGATADDTDTDVNESVTAPLATAGTFGVTMSEGTGDDMVTESFVGAFGAHLDE